jgi:hypothetical protein
MRQLVHDLLDLADDRRLDEIALVVERRAFSHIRRGA